MKHAVVIGATSAIGAAMVKQLSAQGCALSLVGRHQERLEAVAQDARVRGAAAVELKVADLADPKACQALGDWLLALPEVDQAVILPGVLSDEFANVEEWARDVAVNFTAPAYFARLISEKMSDSAAGGHLILVGSVAGDRGRQSNGFYGAQKGALDTYAAALRHRVFLANRRVKVSLVKPGFVVSPMTETMEKNLLFSEPKVVAEKMSRLFAKGHCGVVYAPGWWRLILWAVKAVPGFIFHRTRL